jgi:16S rRNA (adenine1518-N6/adenine1519-N6)-dimethyltransferase
VNLKELLAFLESVGRRPNKMLSQNFLIDQNVVEKIVKTAEIQNENILEIGPGPGALTSELLKTKGKVFAVEKDPVLARELNRFQNGHLTVFSEDILTFDFTQLQPFAPLKVIGNLPYHITTPIFEKLFQYRTLFSTFTVMIQEEVATKMGAHVGDDDYGSLSIFVQFHTTLLSSFKVSSGCFYPRNGNQGLSPLF